MAKDSNTVYVGLKPTMSYVLAVITSFYSSDTKDVAIKARGRAITTAVDVTEMVNRKYMKDISVSDITIRTEEIQQQEDGTRNA